LRCELRQTIAKHHGDREGTGVELGGERGWLGGIEWLGERVGDCGRLWKVEKLVEDREVC
jgi:hypothetical protein